ncbi:hypothetical protein [Corynebacterium canis]|uniref:hypothetical protein n=1 Tax=Corynebacterium canis TaxID=679663 RepID=UPI001FE744F1|nr:hypothetical protein [Corynebacterium canis]
MEEIEKRCEWCGKPIPLPPANRGRPKRYCNRSCRQRAYEQRNLHITKKIPRQGVRLSYGQLLMLHDRLFALRCASEDIQIALQDESPDQEEIQQLCEELIRLAKTIENSY